MSKITSRKLADGDIQQKPRNNAQTTSRKAPKKPMKSNITNKMRTRRSEIVAAGDTQGEDEEGDSSATEEADDTPEDPDVSALPGAQRQSGGEPGKRLAGRDSKVPYMFKKVGVSDDAQTIAGADEEGYDESDEDDYDDLEDVSDGEESVNDADERSILQSAEKDLIDEYERKEERLNATLMTHDMNFMVLDEAEDFARRLSLQGSDSQTDEFGFPIDMNEDPFHGFNIENESYHDLWDQAETSFFGAMAGSRESSDPASATQKRVRFEEIQVDSSNGSDSEDPNEAFPDLLDASEVPGLKRRIALGLELTAGLDRNGFNDAESFYDFEDEDERRAFEIDEESDSDEDLSSSDSDDDGDTTDEESREEQIAQMKARKLAMGTLSNGADNKQEPAKPAVQNGARTTPNTSTSRPTTPKSSNALKLGTFALDPTRATITTDSDGKKIKLLPPATPLEKDKAFWDRAKTANSSRDGSPGNTYLTVATASARAEVIPDRPFTTESTLGSMFQGNLDILRNNDVNGIADDMFPAMVNSQASFVSSATMDDSDTDTGDVNMQDFFDFDDCDSDTDEAPSRPLTSSGEQELFDVYMAGGLNSRCGSDLMGHFDQNRGVIGSFRRNQHQARHVSSLASHPAKRASAHEYNALQKGRRGAANTPLTPARKKRASQDLSLNSAGVRKSISSPLTARRPRSRGNSLGGVAANDLYQTLTRNPFDQA